jgi:hypothetical protein
VALVILALLVVLGMFILYSAKFFTTNWIVIVRDDFLNQATQYLTLLTAVLFFSLIFFAKIIRLRRANTFSNSSLPPSSKGTVWAWLVGVLIALLFFGVLIFVVNPRDYYGTQFFVHWTNPSRGYKPRVFLQTTLVPDLVVSGSSRAFTIQPTYIQERLGLSAFNFSMDSGKIDDVLLQAHFMEASLKFPRVLLVEIREGLLPNPTYTARYSSPILLPYMPPETAQMFLQIRFAGLFSLQQLIEAFWILTYIRDWTVMPGWQFSPDGGGYIPDLRPDPETVEASIDWEVANNTSSCGQLPAQGFDDAEALLQIAERHNSSVVFYLPPMPSRVYDATVRNNELYEQCYPRLMDAIAYLQSKYPQVYFLDYSDVTIFEGLSTLDGFIDGRHMSSLGNSRVIDAAADTLLEAYAQSERAE